MARTKKKYTNGTSRGGIAGKSVDTGFVASGNKNTRKKDYGRVAVAAGFR